MRKTLLLISVLFSIAGTGCSNDDTHIGHWVEDTKGCKVWNGTMMEAIKTTWTGECVDGYTSGKGTVVMEWKAPKPEKNNEPQAFNQIATCTGVVKKGKLNGYTECHWSNGSSYKGTFKDVHPMTGVYTFKNGGTSKIKWVEEKNGCLVWNPVPQADEQVSWDGDCINGYGEGEGTLRFVTNNLEQAYIGALTKGKKNGEGTYNWIKHDKPCDEKKGNIYYCYKSFVGKFTNDLFDKGTYTLISGKKVAGQNYIERMKANHMAAFQAILDSNNFIQQQREFNNATLDRLHTEKMTND